MNISTTKELHNILIQGIDNKKCDVVSNKESKLKELLLEINELD
jgi:hypothetical protein